MKLQDAVTRLSALAQESRLEVFRLLVREGLQGLAAGTIAEHINIPPATLSFHLKELTAAGLIESRRSGRSIIYGLRIEGIRDLMAFLVEDCCQRQPELCAPQPACRRRGNKPRSRKPRTALASKAR